VSQLLFEGRCLSADRGHFSNWKIEKRNRNDLEFYFWKIKVLFFRQRGSLIKWPFLFQWPACFVGGVFFQANGVARAMR
jgi:hypothetical protein